MSPRHPFTYSRDTAESVATALRQRLSGGVRFDDGYRTLYSTDGSNYRQTPIGVVLPRTLEDVEATVAMAREHRLPLLSRGGGTSLAGQCCNTAIVIDFSKYLNRVLDIDVERRRATMEPGCVLDWLREQTREHHLTFGPDPATHDHCTPGGMIGNNSCGVHALFGRRTSDNVERLDILTVDGLHMSVGPTSEEELDTTIRAGGRRGEIYRQLRELRDRYAPLIRERFPGIPRRVSGYNLDELLPENGFNVARALVGSEGTCVTVLQAGLKLIYNHPARVLVVLGFPEIFQAADAVPEVLGHDPVGLEGLDQLLIFAYPEDSGQFSKVALRCVGVGKCRHLDKGVMCPSYMGTMKEMHSTRGRARLLFEMLDGKTLKDGWQSEAVHESLDLCLACKGCKGDCPVDVDMATYKGEFNYHYYQQHRRPRADYALGWIYWWSRAASLAPGLVNAVARTPGVENLAKRIAGIAPQRELPRFARHTFRHWYRHRYRPRENAEPVLLWPDTFNNFLHPEVLIAATEVLNDAGYRVLVPDRSLCCARPLYDKGWLDLARKLLGQIMDTLESEGYRGVPVVGLEPACVAAFRDELPNLCADDRRARAISERSFILSEFLLERDYQPPRLDRRAVVHAHCNHHAILRTEPEKRLLDRTGLDYRFLENAGCCGMAGSFGFEAEKYDLSLRIGERVLLPAVREIEAETLIISNGFSCREQIRQSTGRRTLNLAEVLRLGIHP